MYFDISVIHRMSCNSTTQLISCTSTIIRHSNSILNRRLFVWNYSCQNHPYSRIVHDQVAATSIIVRKVFPVPVTTCHISEMRYWIRLGVIRSSSYYATNYTRMTAVVLVTLVHHWIYSTSLCLCGCKLRMSYLRSLFLSTPCPSMLMFVIPCACFALTLLLLVLSLQVWCNFVTHRPMLKKHTSCV
jgi:hypothetical protein